MQKRKQKLTAVSVVLLALLAPAAVYCSILFFSEGKSFYLPAVILIVLSILPFLIRFERRKLKTGEIVVIAVAVASAVAGRAVMSFLPQVKPTAAVVIGTATVFGPNVGFITGALSMLISNFIFGQGIFTPFQMLGMGLVGFFCGLIFCGKPYANNRLAVSLTGAALTFLVYGGVVDSCSVLTMATDSAGIGPILASGAVFNLLHALNTAILLFLLQKPLNDKLSRLRTKYGIFDDVKNGDIQP